LLAAIQVALGSLEERVARLEAQQGRFADLLGKQIGIAPIQYSGPDVIIDLPPLVTKAVPRKPVVAKVKSVLDQGTWCSVIGASSSGKTQLAILVAQSLSPTPSVWVRLRDRSAAQCCYVVDRALEIASGTPRTFLHEKWYEEVCAKLGKGSLIVLDDLPRRGRGYEDLEARLFVLGQKGPKKLREILMFF
jgi:hypothetical protein